MVLAPGACARARADRAIEQREAVEAYVEPQARRETEVERLSTDREKTGVPLGSRRHQPGQRRTHPDLDRRLRARHLWHRRDHGRARSRRTRLRVRRQEFGTSPSVRVVAGPDDADDAPLDEAYVTKAEDARLVNSGEHSGQAVGDRVR